MLSGSLPAAGFTFNFARKEGIWGSGTYYSTQPVLAMSYEHPVQSSDSAFNSYLAGVKHTKGVQAATEQSLDVWKLVVTVLGFAFVVLASKEVAHCGCGLLVSLSGSLVSTCQSKAHARLASYMIWMFSKQCCFCRFETDSGCGCADWECQRDAG